MFRRGDDRVTSRRARLTAVGRLIVIASLTAAIPVWGRSAGQDESGGGAGLLLLLPVALASFVALQLVLWVLAPGPLAATCRSIERGRGLSLLTGLVATATAMTLASALGRIKGAGELVAALLLGLLLLGVLIGLTAVTALLGQSVSEMAGHPVSRAAVVLIGAVLMGLVVLFPVIGQVMGLYFALVGLGGALLALTRPSRSGK
jgi:hypothetical protein